MRRKTELFFHLRTPSIYLFFLYSNGDRLHIPTLCWSNFLRIKSSNFVFIYKRSVFEFPNSSATKLHYRIVISRFVSGPFYWRKQYLAGCPATNKKLMSVWLPFFSTVCAKPLSALLPLPLVLLHSMMCRKIFHAEVPNGSFGTSVLNWHVYVTSSFSRFTSTFHASRVRFSCFNSYFQ